MTINTVRILFAATLAVALSDAATAQPSGGVPAGTLEQIKVHGVSLEGNLEGDDPTRDVYVYLPPSYESSRRRRYPVVYFLHGYGVQAERYVEFTNMPLSADMAIANGANEMIIVLPDAYTVYEGSMYSNSPTTGDWESFVSRDLVGYIDANYRTLAKRESRGLAGHSMGGYGTVRIGMKHPETFVALYAMSSCCLMNRAPSLQAVEQAIEAQKAEPGPDAPAPRFRYTLAAQAAAFAPNPDNPPQYFDWGYEDGEAQPVVQAKWAANSPLVMVDQYVPNLKRYRAIALDVGNMDFLGASNMQLDEELTRLGVRHTFEVYDGDHMNRVAERYLEHVLPFFSEQLERK